MQKKYYILFILFFLTFKTSAETIIWGEINIEGKKVIYPLESRSRITAIPLMSESECVGLDSEMVKLEKSLLFCKNNINHSFCSLVEQSIRILGQDRNSLFLPIGERIRREWNFNSDNIIDNDDSEVVFDLKQITTSISYGEKSFFKKIYEVFEMDISDQVVIRNGRIFTNNHFTACDLMRGHIVVRLKKEINVRRSQRSEPEMIEIVWENYQTLKNNRELLKEDHEKQIVQASLIGYSLAEFMSQNALSGNGMTVERYMELLIDFTGPLLRLKEFPSEESFKNNFYNEIYQTITHTIWNKQ